MAFNEDCYIAEGVYNEMFKQIGDLNVNKVRDCSLDTSTYRPRSPLISSSKVREESLHTSKESK